MFSTMPPALPHVKAGKLRALAVTSRKRSPAALDLPTLDEAALAGFEAITWHGVVVPAGTPTTVIALLNREIVAILHLPEVVERLSGQGAEAVGSTPAEFAAYISRNRSSGRKSSGSRARKRNRRT